MLREWFGYKRKGMPIPSKAEAHEPEAEGDRPDRASSNAPVQTEDYCPGLMGDCPEEMSFKKRSTDGNSPVKTEDYRPGEMGDCPEEMGFKK